MQISSVAHQIVTVIRQPGAWVLPVGLLAGAMTGYTVMVRRLVERVLQPQPTNVVNLEEERRRRAELTVAVAMGQKGARS